MNKILISLLIFPSYAWPGTAEILVRSPTVQEPEYRAFLQTQSQYSSLIESWHQRDLEISLRKDLIDAFARAQTAFLKNDSAEAGKLFDAVLGYALLADWPPELRKLIFVSYLRIAELKPAERAESVARAAAFDWNMDLDPQSVNSEVYRELQSQKKSSLNISWSLAQYTQDFEEILINGQIFATTDTKVVVLPPGRMRVTFRSNAYKPFTKIISSQELAQLRPPLVSFAKGNCDNFVTNDLPENTKIFFSSECIAEPQGKKPVELAMPAPVEVPKKQKDNLLSNKWFWAAVAAGAGFIYWDQNQEKSETKYIPTRR